MDWLHHSLTANDAYVGLCRQILQNPEAHPDFSIHCDFILYQGKLWQLAGNAFIPTLLEKFHKTSLGGHTGVAKTPSLFTGEFSVAAYA